MLDTICQHFYGHLRGTVEAVLEANEGLAREPQPFRVGLLILLPDLPVAVATASVALWD
jgi:phage tail protein X